MSPRRHGNWTRDLFGVLGNPLAVGFGFYIPDCEGNRREGITLPKSLGLFPKTIWEAHPTPVVWGAPTLAFQNACRGKRDLRGLSASDDLMERLTSAES